MNNMDKRARERYNKVNEIRSNIPMATWVMNGIRLLGMPAHHHIISSI